MFFMLISSQDRHQRQKMHSATCARSARWSRYWASTSRVDGGRSRLDCPNTTSGIQFSRFLAPPLRNESFGEVESSIIKVYKALIWQKHERRKAPKSLPNPFSRSQQTVRFRCFRCAIRCCSHTRYYHLRWDG